MKLKVTILILVGLLFFAASVASNAQYIAPQYGASGSNGPYAVNTPASAALPASANAAGDTTLPAASNLPMGTSMPYATGAPYGGAYGSPLAGGAYGSPLAGGAYGSSLAGGSYGVPYGGACGLPLGGTCASPLYGACGDPFGGACGSPLVGGTCGLPLAGGCGIPFGGTCAAPLVGGVAAPFTQGFTYANQQSAAFGPFTPPVSQASEAFYQYPGLTPFGAYPGAGFAATGGVGLDPISGYYGPYGAYTPL
jgi:hypothetical protein